MTENNIEFIKNLEELMKNFTSQKIKIVEFLKNNFKENIHYIIEKTYDEKKQGRGGHNKINYLLTEKTFELINNSFNLKHRYLTKINDNCEHVNLLMSLENQTIGFIENCFENVIKTKRQKTIGTYRVDLYFYDYKLIIECDENNHSNRNHEYENKREKFLLLEGNSIIRYDPNHKNFDLSLVLREINKIIIFNDKEKCETIKINFD
jgi:very-short-patch-repair endonuclease